MIKTCHLDFVCCVNVQFNQNHVLRNLIIVYLHLFSTHTETVNSCSVTIDIEIVKGETADSGFLDFENPNREKDAFSTRIFSICRSHGPYNILQFSA